MEIPESDIRTVKITNVAGQVIDHQSFEPNDGRLHIQTSRMKPGFYMVEITTADHVVVRTGQVFMKPIE